MRTLVAPNGGRFSKVECIPVALVMAAGALLRLVHLMEPVSHDEAYTVVAFASGTLWHAVTDYSFPNNHVFHTVLVNISRTLLGPQPWAVRLPAFLAGLLVIPAAYGLARRLYGKEAALLSAGVATAFPVLIEYGVIARGYSLVTLFTLIIFLLGERIRLERDRYSWALLCLFAALGFFTIPTMILPAGGLFAWLLLEAAIGDVGESYRSRTHFLAHWFTAGLGTGLLTALFYAPILRVSGLNKLLGNQFVAAVPWRDYPDTLWLRLTGTWTEWVGPLPAWVAWLLVAGFFLSLIFHRRLAAHRVPLPLALGAWFAVILIVERPDAYDRTWSFLAPLFVIWASAGLLYVLRVLAERLPGGARLPVLISLAACLAVSVESVSVIPGLPENWSHRGAVEKAAVLLGGELAGRDLVLVAFPVNAPLWYYFDVHGVSRDYFDKGRVFDRAFVVVNVNFRQSLTSVIRSNKLQTAAFSLDRAGLIGEFGGIQIYECRAAGP